MEIIHLEQQYFLFESLSKQVIVVNRHLSADLPY
jgi:hypothetical protein